LRNFLFTPFCIKKKEWEVDENKKVVAVDKNKRGKKE
jgi:hypothetical protein